MWYVFASVWYILFGFFLVRIFLDLEELCVMNLEISNFFFLSLNGDVNDFY